MQVIVNSERAECPAGAVALGQGAGFYPNRLRAAGYPSDALPVADFLRKEHQLEGNWQVMSPIRWEATHNDVYLRAEGEGLLLEESALRDVFERLKRLSVPGSCDFYWHDAHTWLVRAAGFPTVQGAPPRALLNQSLLPGLKAMGEDMQWQRLLTEIQMLLAESDVNGVWVWGGGAFTSDSPDIIVCDCLSMLEAHKSTINAHRGTVTWYWNNHVYTTRTRRFWEFWRKKGEHTD